MAKTTEHSERDENEIFLESTKAFHLEMPLYNHINISKKSIREKIFEHLNYSGTIDAYCVWCGKESVFNNVEHINITVEWKHEYVKETPFEAWESRGYGIQKVTYACTRNSGHEYYSYYIRGGNDIFVKFGQYPSGADFQIPQAEKYRKVLGEERYKEMTRGLGLIAHGVGIGSFVYLRRVFESLIEEAHVLVQEDSNFDDEKFKKAHIDEKILLLKQHLPNFLVENRILYSILSQGIHELTEEECLMYFETVRIGIEQILDEKIVKQDQQEKALKAKSAVQGLHQKISSKS